MPKLWRPGTWRQLRLPRVCPVYRNPRLPVSNRAPGARLALMEETLTMDLDEQTPQAFLEMLQAGMPSSQSKAPASRKVSAKERAPPTAPPECFSGAAGMCYEAYALNELAQSLRGKAFVIPSTELNRSEHFMQFVFCDDAIGPGSEADAYLCRLFEALQQQVEGGGSCPYTSALTSDTLGGRVNSRTREGCDAIVVPTSLVLGDGRGDWSAARRRLAICEVKYGGVDGKGVTPERVGSTLALNIRLARSGVQRRFDLITSVQPVAGVLNAHAFDKIWVVPAPPEVDRLAQLYKECSVTKAQLYDVAHYCLSELGACEETLPAQQVVNERLCSFHDKCAQFSRHWRAMWRTAVPL